MSSYRIAPNGALGPLAVIATGPKPAGVSVDQFGQFLYVANNGAGNVGAYRINPLTGVLGLIGFFGVGGAPVEVIVDQSGRFLYVADSGTNDVWQDVINPGGGNLVVIGPAFLTGAGTVPLAAATRP